MMRLFIILVLAAVVGSAPARAHEVRPAYLELRQTSADTYDVLWKVPARGDDLRLGIYVRFPDDVKEIGTRTALMEGGAFLERWKVHRPGGLDGQTVRIDGLPSTRIDVLARVERSDGVSQTTRITPDAPEFVVEGAPSQWRMSATYLRLGIEHILLGIDHLLFVLALLLIIKDRRMLAATITAFTLAHSITLALASLNYVTLPGPPVEAIIALSIVLVAAEILRQQRGENPTTARWPWVVAFTFGLLHGFGFAGALAEIGLPQKAVPLALLMFNVGVEAGQLLFVAAVLLLVAAVRRLPFRMPEWANAIPPYAIGSLAMFWVIERSWEFTFGLVSWHN